MNDSLDRGPGTSHPGDSGSLFADADRRDLAAVEGSVRRTLAQIEFLRANGPTDTIRWGLIAGHAFDAWRVAAKADRRTARKHGRKPYRWWIPKGYAS